MQAKDGPHVRENKIRPKRGGNSTYANGETDRSNLKSLSR